MAVANVRKILPSDLPEIERLERRLSPRPWCQRAVGSRLGEDRAAGYLCETEGGLLGYALVRHLGDTCEVTRVVADEDGRAPLVAHLDVAARKSGRQLHLFVQEADLGLQQFLKGREMGAKLKPNFYGKNRDAILFSKKVSG
jgi:hypothetical protein